VCRVGNAPSGTGDQLVVQLPLSEATDFDSLISIENGLIELFRENRGAEVDGHDIGPRRFNIFIVPDESWAPALGRIRACLEFRGMLEGVLIARRPRGEEHYEVVWPADYGSTFEL
jgi:hypothetical protein